jgi:hypothetical protein
VCRVAASGVVYVIRAVFTHRPKGPRPRAANFQGRHIKKIEIEVWNGGGRLSTREKCEGDLYWKHYIVLFFCQFFVLIFYTHNWIRTNGLGGGGAHNILGPRGVKYLNTGLYVILCMFHQIPSAYSWLEIERWRDRKAGRFMSCVCVCVISMYTVQCRQPNGPALVLNCSSVRFGQWRITCRITD